MPVSKTKRKKYFTCNGSTTVFAVNFPITAEADVLAKVRTDATGVVVTLELTTDYSLSKAGVGWDSGGNVTTVATYTAGKTLIVARKVTLKQSMDLLYGDRFDSEAMEDAIDKNTMMIQELQEQIDRCIKIPISDAEDTDTEVPNSVERASKYYANDAEGGVIATEVNVGSAPCTDFGKTILDDETAAAVRTTIDVDQKGNVYEQGGQNLKCKVLEIGDWDMDTLDSKDIEHGLGANYKKIRAINVIIRPDSDVDYYDFNSFSVPADGIFARYIVIDSTYIGLNRDIDGWFDTDGFDSTSFNRGWVTIWYEV